MVENVGHAKGAMLAFNSLRNQLLARGGCIDRDAWRNRQVASVFFTACRSAGSL
jgi:hypothetical protein